MSKREVKGLAWPGKLDARTAGIISDGLHLEIHLFTTNQICHHKTYLSMSSKRPRPIDNVADSKVTQFACKRCRLRKVKVSGWM